MDRLDRFFLAGVADQAGENERRVREILALYDRTKTDIVEVTRSQHGVRALGFVFRQPVSGSAQFVAESRIPKATAQRFLARLRDVGLRVHPAEPGTGRLRPSA